MLKFYEDKITACFEMGSIVNMIKAFKLIRQMNFIFEKDKNHVIWSKIKKLDI